MASCTQKLSRLADGADELLCRFSNGKIHLLTKLGKVILPPGYWGHPSTEHEEPTLYLTFDDGPHPATTPALLELLEKHQVKATFFLVGDNCRRYPHLVSRIHAGGHTIGNHSYNHLLLPILTKRELEREIKGTNQVIEDACAERPRLFRPPFGFMDSRAATVVRQADMTPVYWNSAPEDWLIPGTRRVIRRVMWKIADGTLIVLHEGAHLAEQTAQAAEEIIQRSLGLGYQFSRVKAGA